MVTIRLRNSMTRRVEPFTPLDPEHVRVYLCGPTVYDRAHLGNARNVILFDVLTRLLRHDYPRVTYARNVTDVDDKINDRAAETGRSIREITEETLGWYHDDMGALGCLPPDIEPRATEHIAEMIAMIEELIESGNAYAAEGHVLFDVRSYDGYGKLSGRSVEDMIAGARVEVAPYKRDPMDFVLWKPSTEGTPGWDSPWGRGRPGWHIECSAMSRKHLGAAFDIHGGGNDLMFPHHENERAQSCCANPEAGFAQVWLHNEMLLVEGKKMSKSLGNFFTVRDLLDDGVPGEVIRFVFLSTHYSKPMDWTEAKAREAEATLRKWHEVAGDDFSSVEPDEQVLRALRDDLNTPAAIAELHRIAQSGNGPLLRASAAAVGLLTIEMMDWIIGPKVSQQFLDALRRLSEKIDTRTAANLGPIGQVQLEAKLQEGLAAISKHLERTSKLLGDYPQGPLISPEVSSRLKSLRFPAFDGLKSLDLTKVTDAMQKAVERAQLEYSEEIRLAVGTPSFTELRDAREHQIVRLLKERSVAKSEKDYAKADQVRAEIKAAGFEVIDTAAGPRWKTDA